MMRCFSCIISGPSRKGFPFDDDHFMEPYTPSCSTSSDGRRKSNSTTPDIDKLAASLDDRQKVLDRLSGNSARCFAYRELAVATRNFREANLIGEGGFGRVYRGNLDNGQVIAVKKLKLDSLQGNQEFIVEVLMLSLLHHPNLVTLIGYCAEGDQRLLVYEFMSMGSLADHLFDLEMGNEVLPWSTRIKIAAGAAQGIEYLHCQAKPPVIYRDLKAANILLDNGFKPKLSDFGLAKLGPTGDKSHVSTRVMGTYGYCAPDYAMSGKLTMKSDIFSFGVVLLELITGRKAYDITKRAGEQSLVAWSKPLLRDRKRYVELVDPRLRGRFPARSARHIIALTAMCLNEEPSLRPPIGEIVVALEFLASECQSPTTTNVATADKPEFPAS